MRYREILAPACRERRRRADLTPVQRQCSETRLTAVGWPRHPSLSSPARSPNGSILGGAALEREAWESLDKLVSLFQAVTRELGLGTPRLLL
jgi:hypothetical protein